MSVDLNSLLQIFIGAVVGFVSAIFAEPVKHWLCQSRLEVAFGEGSEYKARTPEQMRQPDPQGSGKEIISFHNAEYIRIKVTNRSSSIAKNCCAFLVGVQKKNPKGKFEPTIYCDSIPLVWSCREDCLYGPIDLPKDVVHFIDLVTVRSISGEYRLGIKTIPFRYAHLLRENGTYRFKVQVSGENVKPKFISVDFSWNGVWDQYEARIANSHFQWCNKQ